MHEITNRPVYRWTEVTLERKRAENGRRHQMAVLWGILTAVCVAAGIIHLFG